VRVTLARLIDEALRDDGAWVLADDDGVSYPSIRRAEVLPLIMIVKRARVAPVVSEAPQPLVGGPATVVGAAVFWRERESAEIIKMLGSIDNERPVVRCIWLHGGPGVGKTTLATSAAETWAKKVGAQRIWRLDAADFAASEAVIRKAEGIGA